MSAATAKGVSYPLSSEHTRLWEHYQATADTASAAIASASAARRVMAAGNTFTNQTTYGVFPEAADRAALTISFTKENAGTKLILCLHSTSSFNSGVAQLLYVGVRIASTDYDVGMLRSVAATVRNQISGDAQVTGLAAGAYTIEPVFKTEAASGVSFNAVHDFVSYSVTEAW